MRKTISNIVWCFFALSFLSCDSMIPETPPFIITRPVFELAGSSYDFTYAGISFNFLNKAAKTINSVTASFMLFDERMQSSPFIGSNLFEIKKLISISPGENTEIVLSLDKFIYIAPTEPYLIDFFYICEITYSDGGKWEDKYGTYRVP